MFAAIISAMSLGAIILVAIVLLLESRTDGSNQYQKPLLITLACFAYLAIGPLLFHWFPSLKTSYIAFLPLCFFLLVPSLKTYLLAITASEPWRWQAVAWRSFLPTIPAIVLAVMIVFMPHDKQVQLFFGNDDLNDPWSLSVAIAFFGITLFWIGLSIYQLGKMILHIRTYRQGLHQVFASDHGKDLVWLEWFVGLVVFSWLYAVLALVLGDQYQGYLLSENGSFICLFAITLFLGICGITQKPGYAEVFSEATAGTLQAGSETERPVESKYVRSALSEEQAQRIAQKLQQAIYQEQKYLDASLTLFSLAKYIGVTSQYLSQTLNQTLNSNFFDYINQARIEAAKNLLLTTDKNALDIAMTVGFNAKSSFYKAFKANTGMTPVQFRKVPNSSAV